MYPQAAGQSGRLQDVEGELGVDTVNVIAMEAIRQVPRALGLMDRDPESITYGCADRYYWHYKFHDYPNARFQEVSELLALAYLYRHPENPYCGRPALRDWSLAAVRYWETIMQGDGTFDEAYPYERSFCATAFSTMHSTNTLVLLGERMLHGNERAADWLAAHNAPDTANQRAASAAAMAQMAALTGNQKYRDTADARVRALCAEYEKTGRFNEYGGADLGYSSITMSALAVYAGITQDADISRWLDARASELGARLADDGSYDYAGQSRSTRFFYPYALAWSSDESVGKIARGVTEEKILKPSWMDDRYMIAYAADYLRSAIRLRSAEKEHVPEDAPRGVPR